MVDAGQFEHQIQVGPNRVNGEPVELSFPRYWKGYIVGTNRVEVAARLERDGEQLKGRAAILDRALGPVAVRPFGSLRNNQADIDLREFRGFQAGQGLAVNLPVMGKLRLSVDLNTGRAEGQSETDIGTRGCAD